MPLAAVSRCLLLFPAVKDKANTQNRPQEVAVLFFIASARACHECPSKFTFIQLLLWLSVALYRAIRLRFGHGFESRDAKGPRNVKITNPAKQRPTFSPLLPVGSQESVLKVPKRRQFHAAIRVTTKRCDSYAQGPRSTRETDGIAAKLLRYGIASEALQRSLPLSCGLGTHHRGLRRTGDGRRSCQSSLKSSSPFSRHR